jgi:hypothetical protein
LFERPERSAKKQMQSSIDWKEVRRRAIDYELYSFRAIARGADIHYNSVGKAGPYMSTTLDALASLLECQPQDIIAWEPKPESEATHAE